MEYWEFLLQKEGDRSWLPIKSPKIEIAEGRYRVVAHSSRSNTDVEVNVTHDSTEEVPPRRRFQKRSRRTNPEGLMVVIPFTYLKPGLWQLRCGGDIMSDFLCNSWQHAVELQVLSKVTDVEPTDEPISPVADVSQTPVQANLTESLASSYISDQIVESEPLKIESPPLTPQTAEFDPDRVVETEPLKIKAPPLPALAAQAAVEEPEIQPKSETPVDELESGPATLEDTVVPLEPSESDKDNHELNGNYPEEVNPTNPILDKSLQMLEQILQQVLEPVLQDFERGESPEPQITAESDQPLETDTNQQGFILTLNEDGLIARRGESLTIAGNVDVLDLHQINGSRTSSDSNSVFQGTLRYELRNPQSLRVLLDVQQPLSEQVLPLAFSHTLEIPPDCNTRLILGKVTLYNSTSVALASQPFSVTADLDELLEAIIPGTQVMPVAKMLVLANNPTALQDNEAEPPESASPLLDPTLLDLINTPESRQPTTLKPAPSQPLPPKIYQTSPTQRSSKSLQLPDFPRLQTFAMSAESSAALSTPDEVEVKSEDSEAKSQPVALAENLSPATSNPLPVDTPENMPLELQLQEMERQLEEAISEEDLLPVADSSSSALDTINLSDAPVQIADFLPATSDTLETPASLESTADLQLDTLPNGYDPAEPPSPQASSLEAVELKLPEATDELETITPATDSQSSDSDLAQLWDTPEPEISSTEVPVAEPVVDEPAEVDNAFQSLKIQDRFWLRLNSLAADIGLSEWLKSDGSPSSKPADVEKVTQQSNPEQVLVDFDESMWEEESDGLDNAIAPPAELQSPPVTMSNPPEEDLSDQPPLLDVSKIDWTAQEIVVDDEDFLPTLEQSERKKEASGLVYQPLSLRSQPKSGIISSRQLELPLPAPTVLIPTNELATGETVTVRVKLPPHPARLCIKLWIQDRQSRSLLDGPRWLVDLIPDGAGLMEAMTQLTVPFGSAEIRFEAIAVDLDSQRESHKVSVDCVVLPSDLLSLSLDEFDA
ncbi:MAG TPA: hypothetical protein V6D48_13525 [Oculatellaceae cyanobacterium]